MTNVVKYKQTVMPDTSYHSLFKEEKNYRQCI